MNSLKSKLSVRSAKPIPIYAFLPASSTRITKYLDESNAEMDSSQHSDSVVDESADKKLEGGAAPASSTVREIEA